MAAAHAEKKPQWEVAEVISQDLGSQTAGAYAAPIGNGAIAVPIREATNVIVIETSQYRYSLCEPNLGGPIIFRRSWSSSPLVLPVHETVQFYRDGSWFVFVDSNGKKHRFNVVAAKSLTTPQHSDLPKSVEQNQMSAEVIFSRFAGRIVFLTCDVSQNESRQASGVLLSDDGFVVTNAHVVEGCQSMIVTYISGTVRRSYSPLLKYYDKLTDTAVLKVPEQGIGYFSLPSRSVRVGERVYSIGNPRGLEQSISEGIVSGNREEDGVSWIQHSSPISPGSSGGALLSSQGELLGINSFLLKESQNINFAVPATTLAHALTVARARTDFLGYPQPTRPDTKQEK